MMTEAGSLARALLCVAPLTILATSAQAQDCDPTDTFCQALAQDQVRGFTGYEHFSVSSDPFGQLTRLDTSIGYDFSEHFGVDAGIPLYFAHNSSLLYGTSKNGVGNLYADLRFTIMNPVLNLSSILTGWAPTGNVAAGFGTGRATFDWYTLFDRDLSRFRPFAEIGIANAVTDTGDFVRPYTTLGLVTHFEGGGSYQALRWLRVGASGYEDLTSGQQKVYSRLIARGTPALVSCAGRAVFSCASETAGPSGIARDHGFSAWAQSNPFHGFDLRASYTRSIRFQFNAFSFGIGYALDPLLRRAALLAQRSRASH